MLIRQTLGSEYVHRRVRMLLCAIALLTLYLKSCCGCVVGESSALCDPRVIEKCCIETFYLTGGRVSLRCSELPNDTSFALARMLSSL